MISSHTQLFISVLFVSESHLSIDQDLLFESSSQIKLSVYAHIVDHIMSEVIVINETEKIMILLQKTQLRQVVKYKADRCYSAHSDVMSLASCRHN